MKIQAVVIGACLLARPLSAGERVTLKVSPLQSFAPSNLVVRAMVEIERDNRTLEVSAESDDFYRSSEIQLDGDQAPRTSQVVFESVPAGHYTVRADVWAGDGRRRGGARQDVTVMGLADER
jgi:hypothetical protein